MIVLSETDVILNFLEDCKREFISSPDLHIEFPAGSWSGAKNRNTADIHGENIPGIEAKGTYSAALKDFHNSDKNNGICHYIYSSENLRDSDAMQWRQAGVAAAVFLTSENRWCIINDHQNLFRIALRPEKIYEIPGQQKKAV